MLRIAVSRPLCITRQHPSRHCYRRYHRTRIRHHKTHPNGSPYPANTIITNRPTPIILHANLPPTLATPQPRFQLRTALNRKHQHFRTTLQSRFLPPPTSRIARIRHRFPRMVISPTPYPLYPLFRCTESGDKASCGVPRVVSRSGCGALEQNEG
jgi:hypothetical protein